MKMVKEYSENKMNGKNLGNPDCLVVSFNEKSSAFGVIIPEDVDELSRGFNSFDFTFENIGYECSIIGNRFENEDLVCAVFENADLLNTKEELG
jgi:hypothetical protein